jgi:hypothetical protein
MSLGNLRLQHQSLDLFVKHDTGTHLKNMDQGSGQVVDPELAVGGGGWRKNGAYTLVYEYFEPTRNAAMGP